MAHLDNLRKQAKQFLRWHRDRYYPVAAEIRAGLPPYDVPFARFTRGNGVLADGVSGLSIQNVRFREIPGFAILVSRSRRVTLDRVQVASSGSRNPAGRNNTTGGILLEEGTSDFRVANCALRGIRGNGVWTHSLYTSPRNARGQFLANRFEHIGRDAQLGALARRRCDLEESQLALHRLAGCELLDA